MIIGMITHVLRTPLNMLSAILKYIQEHLIDESLKAEVLKGMSAVMMQEKLIDDILDMVKISHGKLSLNIFRADIKEIFMMFSYKVNKNDKSVPGFINIDEKRNN